MSNLSLTTESTQIQYPANMSYINVKALSNEALMQNCKGFYLHAAE